LAASRQVNHFSLSLYSWRILLGGFGIFLGGFWPPR